MSIQENTILRTLPLLPAFLGSALFAFASSVGATTIPVSFERQVFVRSVPSGVYFYRLEAGDQQANRRMLLVK